MLFECCGTPGKAEVMAELRSLADSYVIPEHAASHRKLKEQQNNL